MERINNPEYTGRQEALAVPKTFLSGVFMWMFLALGITAGTAYAFASTPSLISLLINTETGSMNLLGWVVMLAPLGLAWDAKPGSEIYVSARSSVG